MNGDDGTTTFKKSAKREDLVWKLFEKCYTVWSRSVYRVARCFVFTYVDGIIGINLFLSIILISLFNAGIVSKEVLSDY